MSTALELVERAQSLGAKLWTDGDRLELEAPADFPDELIGLLSRHKPEVLRLLRRGQGVVADLGGLLAWASDLAERSVELDEPVTYIEASLRAVKTQRVSFYAGKYLRQIALARLYERSGGWGRWTSSWWREMQAEAIGALSALRETLASSHCRIQEEHSRD